MSADSVESTSLETEIDMTHELTHAEILAVVQPRSVPDAVAQARYSALALEQDREMAL